MNPLKLLEKAINEHGSSVILKERLEQLKEQFELLQQDNIKLKEENIDLREQVYKLTKQIDSKVVPEYFSEHRGAYLRKNSEGEIEPDVYCMDCLKPMTSLQRMLPFTCSKCKASVGFTGGDFDRFRRA